MAEEAGPDVGERVYTAQGARKEALPAPMKLNSMLHIETRSKRVQLLMQPTLHARLRKLAAQRGHSLNDLVHEALEKYAEYGEL